MINDHQQTQQIQEKRLILEEGIPQSQTTATNMSG